MIGQGSGNASLKASIACPSEQELLDSLEGHIAMSDEASVVEHLDRCGACRDRLQRLAASDALWSEAAGQLRDSEGRRIPRAQKRQGPATDADRSGRRDPAPYKA